MDQSRALELREKALTVLQEAFNGHQQRHPDAPIVKLALAVLQTPALARLEIEDAVQTVLKERWWR